MKDHGGKARGRRFPWSSLITLGLVGAGIFVLSALIHFRVALEGQAPLDSSLLSTAIGLANLFGFAPAIYLCLLLVLWGGIGFVSSRLRRPLGRVGASFLFAFCLAGLSASMGFDGGSLGADMAPRMGRIIGMGPTFVLLAFMSLVTLVLSTDWFFYRSFARKRWVGMDPGVAPEEEACLDMGVASLGEAERAWSGPPDAPLGDRPSTPGIGLQPVENRRPRRRRPLESPEQDLALERVLEDARNRLEVADLQAGTPQGDPLKDLEDQELLSRAGHALDDLLGDGEEINLAPSLSEGERLLASLEDPEEEPPRGEEDAHLETSAGRTRGVGKGETPEGVEEEAGPGEEGVSPEPSPQEEEIGIQAPSGLSEGEPEEEDRGEPEGEPVVVLQPIPKKIHIYHEEPSDPGPVQEELFASGEPDAELLDRAARVLLTSRRPMPSLLQRRLGLGFAEARLVLNYMKDLGVLSEPRGSGPWRPLIDLREWEERQRS